MVGATFSVAAAAQVLRSKKSVIANGNAQVDTAQSKFGGSSALFDGTDDWLEAISGNNDWKFLTGNDFTFEGWFRSTNNSGVMLSGYDSTTFRFSFYFDSGQVSFFSPGTSGIFTGDFPTANTWNHWAITRNSGVTKFWYNGTETLSTSSSWNADITKFVLGGENPSGSTISGDYSGYIDEFRISNSARYTTTFTPATTPFVNDENTLLLLHMDGTDASTFFEDDNGVGRSQVGITAVGNAQVDTAQSKFGGSSALFDGTGDYLLIKTDTDLQLTSAESWTIEMWIRPASVSDKVVLGAYSTSSPFNGYALYLGRLTSGVLEFYDGGNWRAFDGTFSTNTWYHIAVSSSAGSVKLFKDGTQQTTTFTAPSGINNTTKDIEIGAINGSAGYNGHIDELRYSNIARYTASFTAPTAPFVNDTNTLLLIHADGTDASTFFEDDNGGRAKQGVTAIGNAQIDTAQSKFGGSSYLGDGTGDYLDIKSSGSISLSNSYTIECWYRVVDASAALIPLFDISSHLFYIGSSGANYYVFRKSTSSNLFASSTLSLSNNTWYHVAWVRNGTSFKTFHNGVEVQTNSSYGETMTVNDTTTFIGRYTASWHLNGHIDEFRISNTARYTAAFTPSTTPFQNDSNTLLLLHMDGTDASTVFTDDNGVPPDWEY
jgi:hypothetical protein